MIRGGVVPLNTSRSSQTLTQVLHLQFATGSNTSNPSQMHSPPLRLPAAYDHQPSLGDPPQSFGPNPFILQPGQPSLLTWPPQAMYPGTATPGQELLSLASTAASTGSLARTLGGQQQMLVPAVAQLPEASQVGHCRRLHSLHCLAKCTHWHSLTCVCRSLLPFGADELFTSDLILLQLGSVYVQVSLPAKRSQKPPRKSWEDALRARSGPLR